MKICEQILKNIAGRIPETTRSRNPFKWYPTTHQTNTFLHYLRSILKQIHKKVKNQNYDIKI